MEVKYDKKQVLNFLSRTLHIQSTREFEGVRKQPWSENGEITHYVDVPDTITETVYVGYVDGKSMSLAVDVPNAELPYSRLHEITRNMLASALLKELEA